MSSEHRQKSKTRAEVRDGSYGLVCFDSALPAPLCFRPKPKQTRGKHKKTVCLTFYNITLSSYMLSFEYSQHPC